MTSLTRKTAYGAVGVLAAVGITGTAWAETGSGGSVTGVSASSTSATSSPAKHRARGLLRRTDHATAEIKVKGQWVTYTLDRGKVTSVSPTSITLARPDGQSVTETINSGTKFKGVTSESAIKSNKAAEVISDNGVAVRIRQAPASAS